MTMVRAYRIDKPEWADMDVVEEADGIRLTLTDKSNGNQHTEKYFYYKDSAASMMMKLNFISQRMARKLEGMRQE